jgi:hypothetical protein
LGRPAQIWSEHIIDQSNASELAKIAREVGAHVFEGQVAFPSDNAGWLVGKVDFGEDILSSCVVAG